MTLNEVEHGGGGGGNPGFWQNSMRMPSTPSPRLPTPGPPMPPSGGPGGPGTPGTPGVPTGPLTPQPHSSPSPGYFGPPSINANMGPMSGPGVPPQQQMSQPPMPPQYMHQGPPMGGPGPVPHHHPPHHHPHGPPPHPGMHQGNMMGPGGMPPHHHPQVGPGTPGPPPTPMGHHPGTPVGPGQSPGHGPSPRPMGLLGGPMPAGSPVGAPHPNMGPQMGMHGPFPPPQRRHAPYYGQPDYRIFELNKRLQSRTEESDNLWWDAFATEFFEDEASLTLTFCLEDGPKRYTIGRTLIPRYFRSIFEGGVTELYYHLRHPKESVHNPTITLDCDQCTMVTHHGKPLFTKVCTEGRLILDFTFDEVMRIKSWHMSIRTHREFIPRSVVAMHLASSSQQQQPISPDAVEQLGKNITRQGLTQTTLNYLRLCVILEPMQELMSRHKAYSLSPRECLKTTLFHKWQRMVAPPESQRPASKRRKRKGSTSNSATAAAGGGGGGGGGGNKKKSPGAQNFSLASQDVMVVGEPSLMGGEFGDEDERLITRLENAQFEAANGLEDPGHFDGGGGVMTSAPSPWQQQGGGGGAPGSVGPPPGGGGGPPQGMGGGGGGAGTPQGQPPQDGRTMNSGPNSGPDDKKSPGVSQ